MKDLTASIDNSIRSLFQMIALVSDDDGKCSIIDHNRELANINFDGRNEENTGRFAALRRSLKKNIYPEDRGEFADFSDRDLYVERLSEQIYLSMECRLRHADGKYYWSEIIICNSTAEDSTEGNDIIFLIRDINTRKLQELAREAEDQEIISGMRSQYDELFEENMTDQQTGCYNRKGKIYYFDIVNDEAKADNCDLFVCVSDLNGLKHLNDTYGHEAGDIAIKAVSDELKKAAPTGSKIVRIGGDEFLLFAAVEKGSSEPDDFGGKVDAGVAEYNKSADNVFDVGVSYGWILRPPVDNMDQFEEYIKEADAKMYEMRMLRDEYRRD